VTNETRFDVRTRRSDINEAEKLEAYRRDGRLSAGDLEPGLAQLTDALDREAPAGEPDAAFVAGLRGRIEQEPVARAGRRVKRRTRMWAGAGALGVGLLLVGVFVALRPGEPARVASAAEVLQKARTPAASLQAAGVDSLALTMTSTGYFLSDEHVGEVASAFQFGLWYEAPQLMRIESAQRVSVWDGQEFWVYDAERNWAAVVPQDTSRDIFSHGHAYMVRWVGDLDTYVDDAAECRSATLIGEEEVAGRDAHVLELGRSRCGAVFPGSDGRQILWIDEETGLILRREQYSVGGRLAHLVEVTGLEYNPKLGGDPFTFTPPPGTEIEDHREQPLGVGYADDTPAPEYISLGEARDGATFPVLAPAFIPEGFELESVEHHWSSQEAKEFHSHADSVLLRYADSAGNWLAIDQGFGGSYGHYAYVDQPDVQQGTVEVKGTPVKWVEDDRFSGGLMFVVAWQAGRIGDGYEISPAGEVTYGSPLALVLASNVLSVEELARVAESLE
jgi:outer membrane lipoprotein-sorting protein